MADTAHLARPRELPLRQSGRQARLRRPVPERKPEVPDNEKEPERVDIIAITHGHGDHVGDTVDIRKQHCRSSSPRSSSPTARLKHGICRGEAPATRTRAAPSEVEGIKFTLTDANHSSSIGRGGLVYLGEPSATSSRSRTGRRSTSPATRTCSATCSSSGGCTRPTWRCCRSAATTPWIRARRPSRSSSSARSAASRATTGRSPRLAGTPAELRELTDVEIVDPAPGDTITYEGEVVRRDRAPRAGDRRGGRDRRSTARSSSTTSRTWTRLARRTRRDAGRSARTTAEGVQAALARPEVASASSRRPSATCSSSTCPR